MKIDFLLALAVPAVVLVHLAVAPWTKVEESFHLQAAHDVLVYGTPTGPGATARLAARYDHATFPGPVPRTFVGAVMLAGLLQPLLALVEAATGGGWRVDGPTAQQLLRGLLGLANAAALVQLGRTLGRAGGRGARRWFFVLQATQFHVVFYASRTLPNAFALVLTTLAWAFLVPVPGQRHLAAGRIRVALALMTMAGVVFRAEVALLLTAVTFDLVIVAPRASLSRVVGTVATAAATALALSVPIDTYFWQAAWPLGSRTRPLWPELHAFIFNVWHGQASQWGTLPWHWYATSALPRLLLNPAVWALCLPLAVVSPLVPASQTAPLARRLVIPSLLFVAIYSLQPHKEARFVLYVVPPLTAAAALGADQLWQAATAPSKDGKDGKQKRVSIWTRVAAAAVALSVPAALAASTAMLLVSALNYPGGEALAVLRRIVRDGAGPASAPGDVVRVHADVLACMTGVTLFASTLGAALPSHAEAVAWRAAAARLGFGDSTSTTNDNQSAAPMLAATTSTSVVAAAPRLVVDKTETAGPLQDPAFWAQFDYLLAEVGGSTRPLAPPGVQWQPVALVQAYDGIQVLRPGVADPDVGAANVVGYGATVARMRRTVRTWTGGWWIGPRMTPRIAVLRRVAVPDGHGVQRAAQS